MNNNNNDKFCVFGIVLYICFLINNFDVNDENKITTPPQIILAKIKQSVQLVYYLSFYFPVTATMTMKDTTTIISIITYNIPEKSNGIINKRDRSTTCNYTFVKTLFPILCSTNKY